MDKPLIIRGVFQKRSFIPNEPVPDVEGPAELTVFAQNGGDSADRDTSMFDLFGKARQSRSAEDIDAQVQQERQSWNGA